VQVVEWKFHDVLPPAETASFFDANKACIDGDLPKLFS
jgi:hypothetical protein